jgi:multicomponent Na+:H+ antiporter subunit F
MIDIIYKISLSIITFSILLVLIRIAKGPSLPDRVVALDLITTTSVAFLAIYSIITYTTFFLDVGLIIGLVTFLGTVGFAYFLQRRSGNE